MKDKNIKNWILERFVLSELPQEKITEVNTHLQKNPKSRDMLASLNESNKRILTQYPPHNIIPKIQSRYQAEKSKRIKSAGFKRILYLSPILASVLFILLVLLPRQGDEMRLKGTQDADLTKTNLMIHRKSGESIETLKNGDLAQAGDLLQVAYVAADASHGMIISIDGDGMVTLHYPYNKDDTTRLEQDKKIPLTHAYELDQAKEFERFFFITSNSEINVTDILKSVEDLAGDPAEAKKENLNLSSALHQISILLVKEN